jgi:tetratricopeptide (TPR) repeat protein
MVWIMMIFNTTAQIRSDHSLAELDSLISLLPDLRGKERVDHLNMIATSISQRFPDSCIFYANQAKELSDSLLYEFGEAEAVFNIGNGYFYKIDVRNAITHYLAASEYFEKEQPCQEYGNLLMQIASLNRYLENDLKAIEYYKKARNIFMQVDNRVSMMVAQYKVVYSFIQLENFDSALIYARQALKECKEIGHLKHLSSIYQMIGITYEWQDDLNPERERNGGRLAIPFLDSAYYYAKLVGYPLLEQINLANIGECYHHYMNPPDYEKAEAYYLKSLQVNMESVPNQYYNKAEILAWLGEMYADMGNYSKADIYLNKALDEISSYSYRTSIRTPSFQYDRIYVDLNYSWWAKHSVYRGFMELYQYKGEY